MDYLQKILNDYKHQNFEKGVFCDSLILRDITCKSEHYNVIRDIRNVIKTLCETLGTKAVGTLNFDPFDLEKDLLSQAKENVIALNFGGIKKNIALKFEVSKIRLALNGLVFYYTIFTGYLCISGSISIYSSTNISSSTNSLIK